MQIADSIENTVAQVVDMVCERWRQPLPSTEKFKQCKLISHRGEHDNRGVFENTRAAFQAAVAGGVWGIEFDLRWTKDLQPIVFHDPDTRRLFGADFQIRRTGFAELKRTHLEIPDLDDIVREFGGRVHLMVEIKAGPCREPAAQRQILQACLAGLSPCRDFHLISSSPRLFDWLDFLPREAFLPIAKLNVNAVSRLVRNRSFGGLLGHYALLQTALVESHLRRGQEIGTGYVNSKYCLFREINRNVTWLFSDRAVAMQAMVNGFLKDAAPFRSVKPTTSGV